MNKKIDILEGKFFASTDIIKNTRITSTDEGYIETQSVEAVLLLEVVRLLKEILDNQNKQMS